MRYVVYTWLSGTYQEISEFFGIKTRGKFSLSIFWYLRSCCQCSTQHGSLSTIETLVRLWWIPSCSVDSYSPVKTNMKSDPSQMLMCKTNVFQVPFVSFLKVYFPNVFVLLSRLTERVIELGGGAPVYIPATSPSLSSRASWKISCFGSWSLNSTFFTWWKPLWIFNSEKMVWIAYIVLFHHGR